MAASTFVENKQVSGLSLFCEKAKWLTILPNPTPYNILKPPPKPRQAFSLTKHPEQIHVSRGSGGHLDNLFLVSLLIPPSPILSPPTQPTTLKTSGMNKQALYCIVLISSLAGFGGFLTGGRLIKTLPQTKRQTKVRFSNSKNWRFSGLCMCFC